MINLDLEKQISEQVKELINNYINGEELQKTIRQQVDAAAGVIIERIAGKVYTEVLKESQLAEHVKTIVKMEAQQQIQSQSLGIVRQELTKFPVKSIIEQIVKNEAEIKFANIDLPESSIDPKAIRWSAGCLSGSFISDGEIKNFNSAGISDQASKKQISIVDDHVVVEQEFTTPLLNVTENLNVNNLSILGTLEIGTDIEDHGALSALIQTHANIVFDERVDQYKDILNDGKPLITQSTIASTVINSNLRKVGNLIDLTVLGDAIIGDTLQISSSGKIGINCEPKNALTVRDEDAEITFKNTRRNTMFIGSTKNNIIEIGTDDNPQITISDNQVSFNSPITIMGIQVSSSTTVPSREGKPNEIVIVTNTKDNQPLFYICRGGNKWQALTLS